jgi:hypothetical protein
LIAVRVLLATDTPLPDVQPLSIVPARVRCTAMFRTASPLPLSGSVAKALPTPPSSLDTRLSNPVKTPEVLAFEKAHYPRTT